MWWRRDWISQSVNKDNLKRIFSIVLGNRYPSYFPFVLVHGIMVDYKIPLICKDVTVFIHSYKKHAEHLIRDHCTGYYPWEEKSKKELFHDQVRISLSYPPITVAAQGSARELRELNDHLKTFITLISQSKKFQNRNKVKTRWDRRRCSDHHTKGEEGWYFFQFHKMHIFGRFKKFPHVVEWKVWIDILKVFTYFQPSVIEM